ncbi:MAG: four helix bundle protein [Nitrososphaera sp.]|nr:four helix bundle protein [Nitrososphaera sp.]
MTINSMQTFRFLDFQVYKDAKRFYKEVIVITDKFAKTHEDLRRQLIRAALSVVLNIAEGSAKKSDKDFNRYVENALGSINESVAALNIACESQLLRIEILTEIKKQAENIAKQLGGLSKTLHNSR